MRVTGHGVDLGESLRRRVEERISGTLAKYLDAHMHDSSSGHVTLRRDGTAYRTDCVLHLVAGLTIEATGTAHDARASFEQALTLRPDYAEAPEAARERPRRRCGDRGGLRRLRRAGGYRRGRT